MTDWSNEATFGTITRQAAEIERLRARLADVARVVEDNDQWTDCGARVALRHILRATDSADVLSPATTAAELRTPVREFLGRLVRMEWEAWAREQPNPKSSWLTPWDQLTEPEREVDRRIGERIFRFATIDGTAHSADEKPK